MPTQEQLLNAFKAAADSGDEAAARVFAGELQRMAQQPATAPAAPTLDPRTPDYGKQVFGNPLSGGPQDKLQRYRRGVQDLIDRGVQLSMNAGEKLGLLEPGLADIATEQINKEREGYEQRRQADAEAAGKQKPGFDLARAAGGASVLAPLGAIAPVGGAGYGAAAANAAIQGGLAGALEYDPTNSVRGTASNAGRGAIIGAIAGPTLKAVGSGISKGAGYLLGKARGVVQSLSGGTNPQQILQQVPEVAQLTGKARDDLIEEAAQQIRKTGQLDAEALGRKANLLANDVTPLKSMVTRNPQDWALERNLSKLTGPDERLNSIAGELTDVYRSNDAALANKLRGFKEGLPGGSQESLGQNFLERADDLSNATQEEVSKVYEQIRAARGAEAASDAQNLKSTLDDLADSTYAEKLVGSVRNKLKRFGMLDADGNLNSNVLTVTQAEELRKFVNRLPNDFGKRDIIRAIDRDVISGLGEDAFAPAREAAAGRYKLLGNAGTQKAINAAGELSEGKVAQNFIKSQVIDGSERDVEALVKTFGTDDQAIGSLRAGVLQHLESKAINPNSGQYSGANFNKALQEFGPRKLEAVFGTADAAKLQSLARAGLDATYQPAYSAVNNSNTTPAGLSLVRTARKVVGVNLPLLNDAVEAGAARSGYQKQLANALNANSTPRIESDTARAIAEALARAGTPAVLPAANQAIEPRRRPVDKR